MIDNGSTSISVTPPAEGSTLNVVASVTDSDGNTSNEGSDSATLNAQSDASISVSDVVETNDTTPTISGTSTAIVGDISVSIGNETHSVTPNANGEWSIDWPTALVDGNYNVVATGVDAANNETQANDEFIVDTTFGEDDTNTTTPATTPSVEIAEDINNDGVINAAELNGDIDVVITLPTKTEVGDTLHVSINGVNSDTTITQAMIDNGSTSISVTPPAEGSTLNVVASVTDSDGNTSNEGSDSATLDTVAPTNNDGSNTIHFDDDSLSGSDLVAVTFSGSVEADASISSVVISDGDVNTADITVSANDIHVNNNIVSIDSQNLSTLSDGTLTVTMNITDVAGNVGSVDDSATLVSNQEFTTNEDIAHTLVMDDFISLDSDLLALIESVKIVTLPDGAIELNGVEIAAGAEISVADINAGNLLFIPSEHSDDDTSFTFQISDGSDYSSTIMSTITVHAVADAPTLVVTLSNASLVVLDSNGAVVDTQLSDVKVGDTINGIEINTVNEGTSNQDLIMGNSSSDFIDGKAGADSMHGGNGATGDDVFIGRGGNDSIYAGDGSDTAIFSGSFGDYVIEYRTDHPNVGAEPYFNVIDTRLIDSDLLNVATSDAGDHLYSVEKLVFSDGVYQIDNSNGNIVKIENYEEQVSYDLNIDAALVDLDSSESLSIVISGVPTNATLSDGVKNPDGTWSISVSSDSYKQTLSVLVPTSATDFDIKVTATSTEDNDSSSSDSTVTLHVTIPASGNDSNPNAGDDTFDVDMNDAVIFTPADILANDDSGLTITSWSNPDHGTIVVNANGTVTYTPSSDYHGQDKVVYTVQDANGNSSGAVITFDVQNVAKAEDDTNNVDESGLNGGTNAGDGSNITTGNILANDSGESIKITQINGESVSGIETINTTYGTLEINTATGEYTYTLTKATTDVEDVVEVDTIAYTVEDANGDSSSANLNIAIKDDVPNMSDITQTITFDPVTTNLVIVLDKSGSMNNGRMDIAQGAITKLINTYDDLGDVNVKIITFDDNAYEYAWSSNTGLVIATVNGVQSGGGTDYDDPLRFLEHGYGTYEPTPDADQSFVYFMSDGEPAGYDWNYGQYHYTDQMKDYEDSWQSFAGSNFDEVYAIGIGDGVSNTYLDMVAYPQNSGNTILVSDESTLANRILETVVVKDVGNILTGSTNGSTLIGADGGRLESFAHNGVTYTVADATIDSDNDGINDSLSFTTEHGAEAVVNFDNGEYTYHVQKSDNSGENFSDNFIIKVVDGDGDHGLVESAVVSINVEFSSTATPAKAFNLESQDDEIVFDGTAVDAGLGYDTLFLDSNVTMDFDNINAIENIEVIDLTEGAHALDNLTFEDVLSMTDENNELTILGDSEDSVALKDSTSSWEQKDSVTENGHTFDVFTNESVTVKIEQDINDTIVS